MENFPLFLLIVLFSGLAIYADYRTLCRKRCRNRMDACVRGRDYAGLCKLLESADGKRFFKGTKALLLRLDACIQLERQEDIRQLFQQLDSLRMTRSDYIDYNMKKLAYAIQQKDEELATVAWNSLHKFHQSKYVLREADQLYDIYVCHKSNHIDELKRFAEKARNPSSKAMAYYRIAKQYHYQNERELCVDYLNQSRTVYQQPSWHKVIDPILAGDFSLLD